MNLRDIFGSMPIFKVSSYAHRFFFMVLAAWHAGMARRISVWEKRLGEEHITGDAQKKKKGRTSSLV